MPTRALTDTVVFDVTQKLELCRLSAVALVPVGSKIDLPDGRSVEVKDVRLVTEGDAMVVRLDVADYGPGNFIKAKL